MSVDPTEASPGAAATDSTQTASGTPSASTLALLADLLVRYEHQWLLMGETARLEWKLSLRCLLLTLLMAGFFVALAIVAWVGLGAALVYGLYTLGVAPWLLATGFLVLQVVVLVWLWRGMGKLLGTVGFRHTVNTVLQHMPRSSEKARPREREEAA